MSWSLDFRTPKPALKYSFGSRIFGSTKILQNAVPSSKNNANNSADGIHNGANMNSNIESQSPMKFLPVTKSIRSGITQPIFFSSSSNCDILLVNW